MPFRPPSIRPTLEDLEQLGFKPTKGIKTALAALEALERSQPHQPTSQELRDAYLAAGTDPEPIGRLLSEAATYPHAKDAWQSAVDELERRLAASVSDSIDEIVEQFRTDAEDYIATLTWYVSEGQPELTDLLRAGRADDAERASRVQEAWGKLSRLITLRDTALGRRRFNWPRWKNPAQVASQELRPDLTGLDRVTAALQGGGELGWLTLSEAEAAARELTEWEKAESQRISDERRATRRRAVFI